MNTGPQSPIERMTASYIAHPNGTITTMRDWATYEWRTDTPDRPDSGLNQWKIIAEYATGKHQFVWYWDGRFRQASGSPQATPQRWAYLRLQPEVWHPVWQQWVLPGTVVQLVVTVPPVDPKQGVHIDAIAGQQLIDILKRSFTTKQIQDFMDASPYDEPDTGVPEGPL